ncbi:MAG: PASTA domain-containing protein [bacterium]
MATLKERALHLLTPKRVAILALLTGVLLGVTILFDQVLMPWYTRHDQALEVPNLVGKRFESAKELLDAAGLEIVKKGEKYDSAWPFGYVVDQNPHALRKVKNGRRVYVTLSLGDRELQVPDLMGLSETNAEERLKSLGLRIGEREYEYVANEPSDIVIAQSLPPNRMVKTGTAVDIKVSLGKAAGSARVPSILGKTLETAKREIRKSGLVLGHVQFRLTNEFLPNTVIWQSLTTGTKVTRGDTLDLIVTTVSQSKRSLKQ